jgi:2-pyrone-4,6-dicarboxylate lactonase
MANPSPVPDANTKRPRQPAPAGACDTHMHIFGPLDRYPTIDGADYVPATAPMDAYLAMRGTLGLTRTVVVQPSIYGRDHACTIEAVEALGESGRGVAVLDAETPDGEIEQLHQSGFRGTRFNLVNTGGAPASALESLAARVAEFGWHVQVMVLGRDLPALAPRLAALPVDVVIDHMGRMDAGAGTDQPGFRALLELVGGGRCWVKVSGAYRIDFSGPPWPAARPFAEALIAAAPERMLWGTDWPHPDLGASPMPNDGALLDALLDCVPDEATLARILVHNPAGLYGFT